MHVVLQVLTVYVRNATLLHYYFLDYSVQFLLWLKYLVYKCPRGHDYHTHTALPRETLAGLRAGFAKLFDPVKVGISAQRTAHDISGLCV
jgi:hypothetical protein